MTAEELREKIVTRLRAAVKSHEEMARNLGSPEIGSREWRKQQDLNSCAGALALAVEIARLAGTAPQYARSVEHRRQLVAAGIPVKNKAVSGLGYRARHAGRPRRSWTDGLAPGIDGHTKRGRLAALVRTVEPRLAPEDALAIADAVREAYPKIQDYWPMGAP